MAKRSYQEETREEAYVVWRRSGQNFAETKRALDKKGYFISVPTLIDWAAKYDWKDRAARAEAEEQGMKDALANRETKAIIDLEKIKTRYEKYFDALGEGKIDNQAMFAYTGIIKSIEDVKAKAGTYKSAIFLEFMQDIIEYLGKNDPSALFAIERNFDDYVKYAREKYAA
ncbi:MAG: hypothetical protein ACE14T_12685 [Syntrophales bacterium]